MVDFAKKVAKHAAATFAPGEQLLDARVVQPRGATMRQASFGVGGVVGVAAGAALESRRQKKEGAAATPQGGLAATFPTAKVFLSVTTQRLLCHDFGAMSGRPKDVVAEYPLAAVADLQVAKGKLVNRLHLQFADGSAVELDLLKGGGDPQGLVGALAHAQGRAPQAPPA